MEPLPTDRIIDLDGVAIAVTEQGAGDPLVLVCGTSQSKPLWGAFAVALAETHRVISYDHRGIGGSARGEGEITVAALADDLSRLIAALGLGKTAILGWSLGSAVGQKLAIDHPEQLSALILLNTWGKTDAFQTALFTALRHPWQTEHLEVALTSLGLGFSPEFLNSDSFPEVMAQAAPLFPSTPEAMRTVAEQWTADIWHDVADDLGGITAPTLVITGEQDLFTPPGMGRAVAAAIPNSRIHEFTGPGASHAVVLERPGEVADVVGNFLCATA